MNKNTTLTDLIALEAKRARQLHEESAYYDNGISHCISVQPKTTKSLLGY